MSRPGRARVAATLVLVALAALGGLAGASLLYADAEAHADDLTLSPGETFARVDGRVLHLACRGTGEPVVVVDAGTGGWSADWSPFLELVAARTRACAVDRPGYGWSDPAPTPRTSAAAAANIDAALVQIAPAAPLVLVGHSYGGYDVRLLAARLGARAAGVVLVEAAHPEQWNRLPAEVSALLDNGVITLQRVALAAQFGLVRAMLPASLGPMARRELARPQHYRTLAAEAGLARESAGQAGRASDFGSRPLAVVTAARSFDAFARALPPDVIESANRVWLELQLELTTLSSRSRQFV
ncbi:MAG: alpha/beta fold hydrolase [Vicinamibacterales bacterium]